MLLPTIRAKRFVISAKISNEYHKIFDITFHTGETSNKTYIFISFPYLKLTKGVLARFTVPIDNITQSTISYLNEAKRTNNLVKFSHPLDGNAHFSGDKQIKTKLWNKSFPLNEKIQNLFTINFQGLDVFEKRNVNQKRLTVKATDLDFVFDEIPKAIKFTGRWIKATDVIGKRSPEQAQTSTYNLQDLNGQIIETGCLISPPNESPLNEYVLLLSCTEISVISPKIKTFFAFLGGFDRQIDDSRNAHFLGCVYPVDQYSNIFSALENIDFKT